MNGGAHRPPGICPVCANDLLITRLGCDHCGTELSGRFAPSPYDRLTPAEHEMLRVFLASRGNMKELERHLGVSYPTARDRYADLLAKLGFAEKAPSARESVLARLAAGEIGVEEAARLLGGG